MMKFANSSDNQTSLIRMFGTVLILLIIFIFYQGSLITDARKKINISIPPDLTLGANIKPDSIQPTAVYDFTNRIFQALHRWPNNGTEEYKKNIERFSAFFTPSYKAFLLADFERRKQSGELNHRERGLQPLLASWDYKRVQPQTERNGIKNSWVVLLDMELNETYEGEQVKRLYIRYPIKVVRYDVDRNINPWGMALDGYAETPKEITLEDNR